MPADPLNIAAAIAEGIGAVGTALDPYFYTTQEQAKDANTSAAIGAANNSTAANLAIAQGNQAIEQAKISAQEHAIKLGLMGVLGLGVLGIAYGLVRE